jgi:hypothetical protein
MFFLSGIRAMRAPPPQRNWNRALSRVKSDRRILPSFVPPPVSTACKGPSILGVWGLSRK